MMISEELREEPVISEPGAPGACVQGATEIWAGEMDCDALSGGTFN